MTRRRRRSRHAALCVLEAVMVVSVAGCAGTTDQAGGGGAVRTVLQLRDVQSGQTRWTVELGPEAATEPVLGLDVVLVASIDGVVAYQVADGSVRWRVPGAQLPAAVAGSTAVFELNDRVEGRGLVDGQLLWSRSTSGHVVLARDGAGVALLTDLSDVCGAATGSCPPTVVPPPPAGEVPVVRSSVELLDPASGTPRWRADVEGRAHANSSSVSTRHVLVSIGTLDAGRVLVVALDQADGDKAWSATTDQDEDTSSSGDVLAVTSGVDDSRAQVFDGETGTVLWEAPGGNALAPDVPFVDADAGAGFRRDPRTGRTQPGRVPFSYGLAAAGDALIGAGARTLTAVRGDQQIWTAPLPGGARPVTYLAVSEHVVASITSVGQPPSRD